MSRIRRGWTPFFRLLKPDYGRRFLNTNEGEKPKDAQSSLRDNTSRHGYLAFIEA